METLIFTVTNDLSHDQRMIRICSSLAGAGYAVTLVGTKNKRSVPVKADRYRVHQIPTLFQKGFGFYAIYNIRLFIYLLFKKADLICCIDLDSMPAVWLASTLKRCKKVYDAHEYFSQQKEVISRPGVYRVWYWIERKLMPKFKQGYTVSNSIALAFKKNYAVDYAVIRNLPVLKTLPGVRVSAERFILYQGAVNQARGLEYLIPAMKLVPARLMICGDGNFSKTIKEMVRANNLEDKVLLRGMQLPQALEEVTREAYIGLNLVENNGLNQYYSLANKFFDYIQCGLPQVTMNFPEYSAINEKFEVAVLIDDLEPVTIAKAINNLLQDEKKYTYLQEQCLLARQALNWQIEEKKLLAFYKECFNHTMQNNG